MFQCIFLRFFSLHLEKKQKKIKKSAASARITVCYLVELSPYL
jgi:hypothetical protein